MPRRRSDSITPSRPPIKRNRKGSWSKPSSAILKPGTDSESAVAAGNEGESDADESAGVVAPTPRARSPRKHYAQSFNHPKEVRHVDLTEGADSGSTPPSAPSSPVEHISSHWDSEVNVVESYMLPPTSPTRDTIVTTTAHTTLLDTDTEPTPSEYLSEDLTGLADDEWEVNDLDSDYEEESIAGEEGSSE